MQSVHGSNLAFHFYANFLNTEVFTLHSSFLKYKNRINFTTTTSHFIDWQYFVMLSIFRVLQLFQINYIQYVFLFIHFDTPQNNRRRRKKNGCFSFLFDFIIILSVSIGLADWEKKHNNSQSAMTSYQRNGGDPISYNFQR